MKNIKTNIHAYKISDKLYRVTNGKSVKDVWVSNGKILPAKSVSGELTQAEKEAVEKLLF